MGLDVISVCCCSFSLALCITITPVMFSDPLGLKIYVEDNQSIILEYLNTLTRDELAIDSNGYVYIKNYNSNAEDRAVGTELIYQLITNDNTCKIQIGEYNVTGYDDILDATAGGTNTTVTFNPYHNDRVIVYNEETEKTEPEQEPIQISLGHELIHALRGMKGNRKRRIKQNKATYIPKGEKKSLSYDQEELDVVGIRYTRPDGTIGDADTWYFTQNSLRRENGFKERVRYN